MYIDAQSIITAGALTTAMGTIIALIVKIVKWYARQNKQDEDIKALAKRHADDMSATKEELTLITYGLLACLKGLKEQGCNGPVTEAINKIEKHLNKEAHK